MNPIRLVPAEEALATQRPERSVLHPTPAEAFLASLLAEAAAQPPLEAPQPRPRSASVRFSFD